MLAVGNLSLKICGCIILQRMCGYNFLSSALPLQHERSMWLLGILMKEPFGYTGATTEATHLKTCGSYAATVGFWWTTWLLLEAITWLCGIHGVLLCGFMVDMTVL